MTHKLTLPFLLIGLAMAHSTTAAAVAKRSEFGQLADGTKIEAIELSNTNGVKVRIITLGATVQSIVVPDRRGQSADIVLGYATAAEYLEHPQYFGATVGRYANRIAKAHFTLDGKNYELEANNGQNHLHGGVRGFDKVVWEIEDTSDEPKARVVLSYVSPDGEGGYPGNLMARATYSLNDQNELTVEYSATTDSPTIINMTNHSYFNLAGEGGDTDITGHRLMLAADQFTPVDETLIPIGELRDVAGTALDFRESRAVGDRIDDTNDEQMRFGHGYDHNFVVTGEVGTLRLAARLEDPGSGRVMELLTTAPGLQFYSGNFLNNAIPGKSGRDYRPNDALCLEPQVFPDAPNKPQFPSARLDPDDTYTHTILFRFSTGSRND